ncbi:hypothetical protein C0J52_00151 [Blattella germanica]|nr:hypothetical protein C0J52_00151 [Blattella germanica]
MDGIGAEVSQKIRSAIKAKLMELGAYVDEELPDYIMVMVANKRKREQMEDDLQLFLGSNTAEFTNWLHQVLQKLQEVTVASLERKRKSSAIESDGETAKKEKNKKTVDKKKIKKSNEQTKLKEADTTQQHLGTNSDESDRNQGEVSNEPSKTISTQGARRVSVTSKDTDETAAGRSKIILMQSDDDDDEDFINIKADAEAEALLDAELPEELQENHCMEFPPVETKEIVCRVQQPDRPSVKTGSVSILSRLGIKSSPSKESDKNTSPLLRGTSERIGDKISDRLGERKVVSLRSNTAANEKASGRLLRGVAERASDKISDRLGERKVVSLRTNSVADEKVSGRLGNKVNLTGGRRNISVAHVAPASEEKTTRLLASKSDAEPSTLRRTVPRKRPLLSRVVALNKEGPEEEEYDPANPAVGSVASVVRVKPRPKVPAALQANKNLILKAMAEAHKSVSNAPKRIDPDERVDNSITKKFRDSKGRDKIAITLSKRRMQPQGKAPVGGKPSDIERIVIPVKLETTRSISSVNLQQKIVIHVSADKVNDTPVAPESQVVKLAELPEEIADGVDTKLTEVIPEVETEELKDEGFEEIQRLISCGSQDLDLEVEEYTDPSSQIAISPQFVVTLDGLDPTIFNTRKKQDPTSPNLESHFDDKEQQVEMETPKVKTKSASPILFMKSAASEASGSISIDAPKQKINERCKYWPVCRSGDKCDYLHPTVPCKSFPNCKFGDKCLYIHPNCKFDASCTRRDCPFTHVSPRNLLSVVTVVQPAKPSQQICKFFPKCSNVNCRFQHPKMCRYGRYCNRKTECTFRHEEIPPADKLKWICPFRL